VLPGLGSELLDGDHRALDCSERKLPGLIRAFAQPGGCIVEMSGSNGSVVHLGDEEFDSIGSDINDCAEHGSTCIISEVLVPSEMAADISLELAVWRFRIWFVKKFLPILSLLLLTTNGMSGKLPTYPAGFIKEWEGKTRDEIVAMLGKPTHEVVAPKSQSAVWEYENTNLCFVIYWGNPPVRDTNRVWSATCGKTIRDAYDYYGQRLRKASNRGMMTEQSVLAGLRWLKNQQNKDGSWDGIGGKPLNTALAVLAFVGHGETPESAEFGDVVWNGLKFLATTVALDGLVATNGVARPVVVQGVVTLALTETYAMTRSPYLKSVATHAVNAIGKFRHPPTGSWSDTPEAEEEELLTTALLIVALKSASLSEIPVSDGVFSNAARFAWSQYREDGSFGRPNETRDRLTTAAAVLILQLTKHGSDSRLKKSLDYLSEAPASWEQTHNGQSLLLWQNQAHVLYRAGGVYWQKWANPLTDTLRKNQSADGYWNPPPSSRIEVRYGEAGRVYTTSMAVLTLELLYRYLPIFRFVAYDDLMQPANVSPDGSSSKK
jgi:hypothetical protein